MPIVDGGASRRPRRGANRTARRWRRSHHWTAVGRDAPAAGHREPPWPLPAQRPSMVMRRRELLLRRAIPSILAICVLLAVLVPLVLGLAEATTAAARILRHG